jgi:molybdopterin/thiamine biosynthesis adenylyltransferase/rhodanese-related sulfurtransferase
MTDRYARQRILPLVGEEGQKRLRSAHLLYVGAGGLGSAALPYLVAAGIGRITLLDGDTVELSNLARQTLFTETMIGENKAIAAAGRLRELNPEIEIEGIPANLDKGSLASQFLGVDLLLDGSDSLPAKQLLNQIALESGIPALLASVTGWDGQLIRVLPGSDQPCFGCVFPNPDPSRFGSCEANGVLGPMVGWMGALQALEALKILLKANTSSAISDSSFLQIDGNTLETRSLRFQKQSSCPACGEGSMSVPLEFDQVSPALALLFRENHTWIDVREKEEWEDGSIPGAIHLPLSQLKASAQATLATIPPGPLLLFCKTGPRSIAAARLLHRSGVREIRILEGGYRAYPKN